MGVNLADGYEIERRVIAATTPALEQTTKRLGNLQPLMFFLSDLFCPSLVVPVGPRAFSPGPGGPSFTLSVHRGRMTLGFAIPPRPEDIRERLVAALAQSSDETESERTAVAVPMVAESIPSDVLTRINRHRSGEPAMEEEGDSYWRVTVVSRDPPFDLDER